MKRLVDTSQQLIATISVAIQVINDPMTDMVKDNVHRLNNIRESLSTFIRDLSRHQVSRISHPSPTHVFVMISSEQRNIKLYAVPVQCLPYHSINQQVMRQLVCNLMKEMKSRGMKVSGRLIVATCPI